MNAKPGNTEAFENGVLSRVGGFLKNRRIDVPAGAAWDFDQGTRTIVLTIDAAALAENFQKDLAAAPSFLFCLGYWLEETTKAKVICRLKVEGTLPAERNLPHWRRSVFVLEQLALAAPGRFQVELDSELPRWEWPKKPVLNKEGDRSNATFGDAKEHRPNEHDLELSLAGNEEAREDFSAHVGPVYDFKNQLPVGLFEGTVEAPNQWTPGGKSQIDLWTRSMDGTTIHLFELKATDKRPLGILPQAIYYARLLHHLQPGNSSGPAIDGDDRSLNAIRDAERIRMWLVAPGGPKSVHPLLLSRVDAGTMRSPLELLNAAFAADRLDFSILPIETTADGRWLKWNWDDQWPPRPTDPSRGA